MMLENIYKVCKSSWGIYLKMRGEFLAETDAHTWQMLADNFFVKASLPLDEQEFYFLAKGVEYAKNRIERLQKGTFFLSLDFRIIETEYQPEGLCPALAMWLFKYFEAEYEEIEVYFDKEKRRYVYPLLNIS